MLERVVTFLQVTLDLSSHFLLQPLSSETAFIDPDRCVNRFLDTEHGNPVQLGTSFRTIQKQICCFMGPWG